MSKIQLNKNQKEVLFIVALFLVPFLDPGFALLLGLILSLTIGHPFLAINSRITHILLQISVVGLGFGMNVEQAIEAGKTGILFTIFSIVVTIGLGLFFTSKLRVNRDTGFLVSGGTAICGGSAIAALAPVIKAKDKDITVAIMGCVVNGPGEARHADIAIAGGKKEGLLIRKGEIIEKIPQDQIAQRLKQEIMEFQPEK